MVSEFSPLPGTPDDGQCLVWIDLDEPLRHNKTALVIYRLGAYRLKIPAGWLNQRLGPPKVEAESARFFEAMAPRSLIGAKGQLSKTG